MISAVSGEEKIFTGNIKQIAGSQETRKCFGKLEMIYQYIAKKIS